MKRILKTLSLSILLLSSANAMVNITFEVNTASLGNVSPEGLFIAGGNGFGLPGDNRLSDLDGDGKISYEEALDMYFEDASKSEKPWEWDFKEAYERISKRFDLPPGNDPISYDDYCVYTDSEDRTEFDKVDTDNDGIITKEQFIEMIWKGGNSELNEIKTLFDFCDKDGDGFLSVEEFAKFMTGQDDNWAEEKPKVEEKSDDWWSEEDN